MKNIKEIANQNGEILKNVSGGDFQVGNKNINIPSQAGSALETVLKRVQKFKDQQAQNDNFSNGDDGGDDDTPPSSPAGMVIENSVVDNEGNSYQVYIDVDEVSKRTHINKNELMAVCNNTATAVSIPTNLTELSAFITVNQGISSTAAKLSKKMQLPAESRLYFLRKAQEHAYIWLKGEVQLGYEINKIATRRGKRSDLDAANDNASNQRKTANLDEVLTDLRTKKEVLKEDYHIGYTQARQLSRLTDELVEKELEYAINHNDVPSRNHALSFLSRPPELTDGEKDEADTKVAKTKFQFETIKSTIPFETLRKNKLKNAISYCSLFACFGTCEYYLEQHGFICKVASELYEDTAKYYIAMHKMRSQHPVEMIQGDLKKNFKKVVKAFKENKCEMVIGGIPCHCFTSLKGKKWMDNQELTLVLWFVKFVKATQTKYIVSENAKQFFGFSLPLTVDTTGHPLAQLLQAKLKGRTIGQYLKDELEPAGYNLNFSIEDACFYGTAQSRVRSIMLGTKEGVWKWPCAEKYAKPLWEAIGHLPSLDDGDSGIRYHDIEPLHADPVLAAKIQEALEHTATGRCSKDNDPKYQLSGFGFYSGRGTRKFWNYPSNTIDSGNGKVDGIRTIHPGWLRADGTYSDARPLSLLEVILVNGLPQSYKIPDEFENRRAFVRRGMGQVFLPRLLQRICLEIPVGVDAWEKMTTEPE